MTSGTSYSQCFHSYYLILLKNNFSCLNLKMWNLNVWKIDSNVWKIVFSRKVLNSKYQGFYRPHCLPLLWRIPSGQMLVNAMWQLFY